MELAGASEGAVLAGARLFRAQHELLKDPSHPLEQEAFGPVTVLVVVKDIRELQNRISHLTGHLTASLFTTDSDLHGPFPATSDSCSTSVGTLSIEHFLRTVCY
jgi:2,5-dioxopentanoate dehydrogenase